MIKNAMNTMEKKRRKLKNVLLQIVHLRYLLLIVFSTILQIKSALQSSY